ncbi:hypothetical protein MMC24_006322 [Lignoscripta atroalba]|nr:hypothetical protein [Lignoscripta atroalba]
MASFQRDSPSLYKYLAGRRLLEAEIAHAKRQASLPFATRLWYIILLVFCVDYGHASPMRHAFVRQSRNVPEEDSNNSNVSESTVGLPVDGCFSNSSAVRPVTSIFGSNAVNESSSLKSKIPVIGSRADLDYGTTRVVNGCLCSFQKVSAGIYIDYSKVSDPKIYYGSTWVDGIDLEHVQTISSGYVEFSAEGRPVMKPGYEQEGRLVATLCTDSPGTSTKLIASIPVGNVDLVNPGMEASNAVTPIVSDDAVKGTKVSIGTTVSPLSTFQTQVVSTFQTQVVSTFHTQVVSTFQTQVVSTFQTQVVSTFQTQVVPSSPTSPGSLSQTLSKLSPEASAQDSSPLVFDEATVASQTDEFSPFMVASMRIVRSMASKDFTVHLPTGSRKIDSSHPSLDSVRHTHCSTISTAFSVVTPTASYITMTPSVLISDEESAFHMAVAPNRPTRNPPATKFFRTITSSRHARPVKPTSVDAEARKSSQTTQDEAAQSLPSDLPTLPTSTSFSESSSAAPVANINVQSTNPNLLNPINPNDISRNSQDALKKILPGVIVSSVAFNGGIAGLFRWLVRNKHFDLAEKVVKHFMPDLSGLTPDALNEFRTPFEEAAAGAEWLGRTSSPDEEETVFMAAGAEMVVEPGQAMDVAEGMVLRTEELGTIVAETAGAITLCDPVCEKGGAAETVLDLKEGDEHDVAVSTDTRQTKEFTDIQIGNDMRIRWKGPRNVDLRTPKGKPLRVNNLPGPHGMPLSERPPPEVDAPSGPDFEISSIPTIPDETKVNRPGFKEESGPASAPQAPPESDFPKTSQSGQSGDTGSQTKSGCQWPKNSGVTPNKWQPDPNAGKFHKPPLKPVPKPSPPARDPKTGTFEAPPLNPIPRPGTPGKNPDIGKFDRPPLKPVGGPPRPKKDPKAGESDVPANLKPVGTSSGGSDPDPKLALPPLKPVDPNKGPTEFDQFTGEPRPQLDVRSEGSVIRFEPWGETAHGCPPPPLPPRPITTLVEYVIALRYFMNARAESFAAKPTRSKNDVEKCQGKYQVWSKTIHRCAARTPYSVPGNVRKKIRNPSR